MIKEMSHISG